MYVKLYDRDTETNHYFKTKIDDTTFDDDYECLIANIKYVFEYFFNNENERTEHTIDFYKEEEPSPDVVYKEI